MRVRTQAGRAAGIQIGVAIDDQEPQPGNTVQHGPQRRQFPQVELTGPVGLHLGYHRSVLGQHQREGRVARHDGRRPGAAGAQVMHIRSREPAMTGIVAGTHGHKDARTTIEGRCESSRHYGFRRLRTGLLPGPAPA